MNDNDNEKIINRICLTFFLSGLTVGLTILNIVLLLKNK
jgi:hypothetical protein